jgi:hypothetical protein
MLKPNHTPRSKTREELLEMHIKNLRERINELERRSPLFYSVRADDTNKAERENSSVLVLPVAYTPIREPSPKLEIVPYSSKNQSDIPLLLVEQSKNPVYETLV